MKKANAKVVIVGRANVGKSTLFNRLSGGAKSLTFDYAGVTRDTIMDVTTWKGTQFELIDTGGMQKTDDQQNFIAHLVSERARAALQAADVILFLCDATVGVLALDRTVAKELHKTEKPVVVAINKSDTTLAQQHLHEYVKLGFKHCVHISALQGTGIEDLLDLILSFLPSGTSIATQSEPNYRVILLGKPNVGKSSLLNLLAKQERAIVADMPGTTREAIDQRVSFYHEDLIVTDTPGVRRKRKVDEKLETMMVQTAFRALERSDIAVLLIDSCQARLSDQELKLAFYAFEQGKGLLILFNKQDLVTEEMEQDLRISLEPYQHFIPKIHTLAISCKTGKNIGRILPLLKTIWERFKQEFSGQELTVLFKDALEHRPHFHKGHLLKLVYAKQIKTAPITILLRVNTPDWFGTSQQMFLENALRKKYPLQGVPIKFVVAKDA